MTINLCFIIDILFISPFLILSFLEEGLTKTVRVLIILLAKIFTNGKNT